MNSFLGVIAVPPQELEWLYLITAQQSGSTFFYSPCQTDETAISIMKLMSFDSWHDLVRRNFRSRSPHRDPNSNPATFSETGAATLSDSDPAKTGDGSGAGQQRISPLFSPSADSLCLQAQLRTVLFHSETQNLL